MQKKSNIYTIRYCYNNGTTLTELIAANSPINALKRAKSWTYLREAMHQTGSSGTAMAYTEGQIEAAKLDCTYTPEGKWHASYQELPASEL